jgi:hypothetical protein
MDFKNSKIELTLRGMANVFDRTTGVVRMTMKSGLSRVFGAMHSDVRSRDSAPLQKFLDFLEDRSNGINKPFYTGARLEGTSADVGPEMLGGNMYAVALRAVAHRSAMLASAEDMDYVQWLEKNNLLGGKTAQEIYSSSGSEAMQKERMQVVRGEIDLNRIQRLEELLNFVEKATQDESVQLPEHWQKLFADAHKGIAELKEVRSMFGAHRKLWERVYSGIREKHAKEGDVGKAGIVMYEAFCEKGGGMAAKANILTNTEIATILIDKFKVGTVRIPELDGSTKELKLDDEVMAHWLRGEENPDEEYNSARAYLTVLLYDLHAREMLKKYEEEQVV